MRETYQGSAFESTMGLPWKFFKHRGRLEMQLRVLNGSNITLYGKHRHPGNERPSESPTVILNSPVRRKNTVSMKWTENLEIDGILKTTDNYQTIITKKPSCCVSDTLQTASCVKFATGIC